MNFRRWAFWTAVVCTIAILISMSLLAEGMYFYQRDKAPDFWDSIAGVHVGGSPDRPRSAVALHNGRFVYTYPGMDDVWINWIPESEAMAAWPAVERELESALTSDPEMPNSIGYARWKSLDPRNRNGIVGLNLEICGAHSARIEREYPQRLKRPIFDDDRHFAQECARKMDWYWASFLFELLFLSGIIWWMLWPAIRGHSLWRYILHWGLAPTLFLLPSWLGFGIRINGSIQNGSILYAWPTYWFGYGYYADWEITFLRHLPSFLEPLAQHPNLDMWGSGVGMINLSVRGPLSAIYAGIGFIAFVLICATLNKKIVQPWLELHRPSGFDVLPAKDTTPPRSP